jgi:diguanylate cyclase (GGDEF)-like protein
LRHRKQTASNGAIPEWEACRSGEAARLTFLVLSTVNTESRGGFRVVPIAKIHDDDLKAEISGLRATLAGMRARIAELETLADTDALVPLPNRRAFVREVDRAIRHITRHATPAALIFLDLVGLKRVNDVHGHHAGDALLLHVSRLLASEVRTTDPVARIGGDEFGLLLDHLDETAARAKIESLIQAASMTPLNLGRVSVRVAISCGLTMIRAGDTAEAAIARADAAMYAGRASVTSR